MISTYEYSEITKKIEELEKFIKKYEQEKIDLEIFVKNKLEEVNKKEATAKDLYEKKVKLEADIKALKDQYSSGFPLLAKAIAEYQEIVDSIEEEYLTDKAHPAYSSADIVRKANQLKREAIKQAKELQYTLDYLETLYPFITEAKGVLLDELEAKDLLGEYTQEEQEDRVTLYLSKEEFRKLSVTERNQLALDRYWDRRKTKKGIGNLYERYVGYLKEQEGFKVEYSGIIKSFEDLGRDLIATKGNEVQLIQCKYWSEFKQIHEKHIFQFFGTLYEYKYNNPKKLVKGVFYTKTKLSDLARHFSNELGIEIVENHSLERYPCIKCNISKSNGEKIYHLPFDVSYDKTVIESNLGEIYAMTVKEAENLGFRRTYKWQGNKSLL